PEPLRALRPDLPERLQAVVSQMMAIEPADRYSTPLAVMAVLNEFVEQKGAAPNAAVTPSSLLDSDQSSEHDSSELMAWNAANSDAASNSHTRRVLVVSPLAADRNTWREAVERGGIACVEADCANAARDSLARFPADVALVDCRIDEDKGRELCQRLRADAPVAHLKLILVTAADETEPLESEGAWDDQLPRDAPAGRLLARVRAGIRLKESEERADRLSGHLLTTNSQLENAVRQRDNNAFQAQDVLIFAMAKMAELRGQETGSHLLRMQSYVRVLAEQAQRLPAFTSRIDNQFIGMLERCVLLHDIGKVGIPDHILLKPGKLDAEERSGMESHTVLGAGILEAVAKQHGACLAFLQMAIDIVRHHHERWDGMGYPNRLAGDAIPLAARIVTIADVYDAMRSKLVYKPGLSHSAVRRLMGFASQGHFDPALMVAFQQSEANFEQIFEQTQER
ncbi:MAG: HD domain-containing phosphohydrolase, partial [Candidatus Acidiferrum sp.]